MQENNQSALRALFSIHLDHNIEVIHNLLGDSVDIVKREFVFHGKKEIKAVCFYTDGLVNTQGVERLIEYLIYKTAESSRRNEMIHDSNFTEEMIKHLIVNPSIKVVKVVEDGIDGVLSGDTLIFLDGSNQPLLLSSRGWDTRSVSEPVTEQVVRGARDGFTENIRSNTALVRRRIRNPNFRLEAINLGKKTQTDINIAYIKGVVREGLVEEVKERLKKIKIDAILESGYVEELIADAPYSPFTTVQSTERPDKVAAEILEGKVAIFVDNTPFVLVVPTYFWQYLQASDDYYAKFYTGSFFRLVRYFAFIISLTLPSIYVMLASFHQEMIPTPLALTIASGREVVPFPVLLEALIMEIAFELMREAGLRMPKPVGQAVSIVGSLIIGQAAVQAGMVSPFMVIVVAVTGIASFAIPNYAASFSIRLIRFPLLLASGTLGLLGFAAAFSILAIHALSIRSFGESYLAPATPFQPSDQKDSIIRFPWWKMDKQPQLAEGKEERVADDSLPSPNQEEDSIEGLKQKESDNDDNKNKKTKKKRKPSFRKIGRREEE
ncbi:spore germination protein [Neobacillus sp. D3-1R]|uniref:spore germination protein n=1 Tax=Neobacillus sp. D3-1R TaxID=3445778 RepID=UPI003F9EC058